MKSITTIKGEILVVEVPAENDEWISVEDKMPKFHGDNNLSESVVAKGADGVIKENVSLFKSNHGITCYGATQEHYHSNITHWKKFKKS